MTTMPTEPVASLKSLRILRDASTTNMIHGDTPLNVAGPERAELARIQLDTLRRYVEALGGALHITAQFDDATYDITFRHAAKLRHFPRCLTVH